MLPAVAAAASQDRQRQNRYQAKSKFPLFRQQPHEFFSNCATRWPSNNIRLAYVQLSQTGIPHSGGFRPKRHPKGDGSIVIRPCKACQRPVCPIGSTLAAVILPLLSAISIIGSPVNECKCIEDKATPWSALPLGKIVVLLSHKSAPALTGRCVPIRPRATVLEPAPQTVWALRL